MLINDDCFNALKQLPENSVDSLVSDPPYGLEFMGKEWDLAIPSVDIWKEAYRVMKPGAFGFIMCIPRQDCLSRMMISLEGAGFNINFTSIYWTYASGFPKALNIGKKIDKKKIDNSTLDGSYGGFQPKPAVEVIIVVMKPLSAGSYINQALENGKGVTWLDDCRIPYKNSSDEDIVKNTVGGGNTFHGEKYEKNKFDNSQLNGRFPANLLISDDVLDDVSRYFSLDAWAEKNLPFLIVAKASKREKNTGCEKLKDQENKVMKGLHYFKCTKCNKKVMNPENEKCKCEEPNFIQLKHEINYMKNIHPTVKPIKLMSYLITLGSRPGDIILDPFAGSGTTGCAAILLDRKFILIEKDPEYFKIVKSRIEHYLSIQKNKPLEV